LLLSISSHLPVTWFSVTWFSSPGFRVIYYNMRDPFWGAKLIEKVAENILSAMHKPEEAILFARIK
jgi:hypothetical protein